MTAVVAEDCTSIEITSDNFHTDNLSNDLTVTVNGTEYTVSIDTATTTSYTLDATSLDLDELANGVYLLKLVCTLADSTTQTESLCRVLLCGEDCNILPLYENDDELAKVLAFEGLKVINNCVTCNCDVATTLYNTYTDTEDADDCNCN